MSVKQPGFCEGSEAVNGETYREERCLSAVVVFYQKTKAKENCVLQNQ